MLDKIFKLFIIYPVLVVNLFLAILIGIISFTSHWVYGAVLFVIQVLFLIYTYISLQKFKTQNDKYIATMSHRLRRVGEEALTEMPIGVLLYNDDLEIEWANPFINSCFVEESIINKSLFHISEELVPLIKKDNNKDIILVNDRKYKVIIKHEEKLIYFFDVTEFIELEEKYEDEKVVFSTIFLDNYDELTQGINDQIRANINSIVSSIISRWATEHGVLSKRISSDRYFAVLNNKILKELQKTNFNILDEVREQTAKQGIPLTLSIGVGVGDLSLLEINNLAQSSLDLALGRGGDQVSIKSNNGKVKFYGGKTNPVEKRTRVRARVISHALKDLIVESEQVIIMGHKTPDMDCYGASLGIMKIAQMNDRPAYIVTDPTSSDQAVKRLLREIKKDYLDLWDNFVTPEQALEIATRRTLLVIVDTHKPSLTIEEKLINRLENIVVIDHHRRGEEFVNDAILVYMEPYASSTSELVTELLEYQPKRAKMNIIESTALLAGIIVDTKSFTLRTGSRTFDAASYLRTLGADTILVQKLLKEEKDKYIMKANLIKNSYEINNGIAIAKGEEDEFYEQIVLAQAADTLLGMNGIIASFVIAKRSNNTVAISARSLGDINVQLIMENLDGGGHLTNAATLIQSESIKEVENLLLDEIDKYVEGGNSL
jgi:c-di-AMP phosphodiesterase-like protein